MNWFSRYIVKKEIEKALTPINKKIKDMLIELQRLAEIQKNGGSMPTPVLKAFPPQQLTSTAIWESYVTPLSYPNYLVPIVDSINGAIVTRVADEGAFGIGDARQLRHNYSKKVAWNSDGSRIQLSGQNGKMLDGNTYEVVATIPNGFSWSNSTPNKIFNASSNGFNVSTINLNTYAVTLIQSRIFSDYNSMTTHSDENNVSDDDKYVCLYGTKSGSSDCWVVIYDIENDIVETELNTGHNISDIDWFSMSNSGAYVVMQFNQSGSASNQGTHVYNRNMSNYRRLSDESQHGDNGKNIEGEDVFVQWARDISGYAMSYTRLIDLNKIGLMPLSDCIGGAGLPGVHISCRNIQRPGYAYVSISENGNNPNQARPSLQIIAFKLDGSNTIERWCNTYARLNDTKYDHQAQASASPDGKQVIFASNWDISTEMSKDYAKSFVVKYEE